MAKKSAKKIKISIDSIGKSYKNFKLENLTDKLPAIKKKVDYRKILLFIQKKPFTSFFAVLGVFFILMIVGNLLFSPKPTQEQNTSLPKQIHVYKLGSAPQVLYQGKIEKSGVIKIVAQMQGIVQNINVSEGQQVGAGTNILSLSTNYQGGNTLTLVRAVAQAQYQNAQDTYSEQGDIIGKQKDLANKNNDNATLMREIAQQSLTDTQGLANLNIAIVSALSQQLQTDQANGASQATILAEQEQLTQFQSALVQVNSSLRNLELQSSSDQPPAQMAQEQHDIAVEQLDLQRKALDLNLDLAKLQYNIALVNEASMYPSAPFDGVVDKIFVHVGDNVGSGTVLASLSGFNQHAEIEVNVPESIAKNISKFEPSTLYIGGKEIEMVPAYISKDATSGSLYSVIYRLDDSMTSKLTNNDYINVSIPVGAANTTNEVPFIPLDGVVQTQEEAFVYIVDNKNTARAKKITLGNIQGGYVEVVSGLPRESQVILDRNVIEGDKVQVVR